MAEHTKKVFIMRNDVLVSVLIIIATVIVYYQTASHEFINLDDPLQITANNHVQSGFSWENLKWSFTPESPCSPLTWLMYTVLFSMIGLDPGVYHMVSVFLHITSSLLLFFALKSITGQLLKSAFVGALFALHPINVESVAWIAELNNVLSAFFWILTILMYSLYAEHPNIRRYLAVLLVFEIGLLAKPILMTLPFVLLLLDYWPLGRVHLEKPENNGAFIKNGKVLSVTRYQKASLLCLFKEKIPFLFLSGVSIFSTLFMFQRHTNFTTLESAPIILRVANALVSYTKYLGKLFWPCDLALLYPYPRIIPWWHIAAAFLLLGLITILALRIVRSYPYVLIGWLWFFGSLIPFLGIIQGGLWPEMADRYAYVTFIGIYIIIAWGVPDLFARWKYNNRVMLPAGMFILSVLVLLAWYQVGFWKNSIVLFEHVTNINKTCYTAYINLGAALSQQGNKEKAIEKYLEAMKIDPHHTDAYFNLGNIYAEQGNENDAIEMYFKCLEINKNEEDVYINLGLLFEGKANFEKAIAQYREALRINPKSVEALNNMGNIMLAKNDVDEAIKHYSAALYINPGYAELHNNLGTAFIYKRNIAKAIYHFSEAVRLNPDYLKSQNNLQKALEIKNTFEVARGALDKALKADPRNPSLHYKMGELYRDMGDSVSAINHYQNALSIDPAYLNAMFGVATVYSINKEYEEAIGVLQKMRQIEPDNADIYYNIACMQAKQNKGEESIYWLNQATLKGFNNWNLIMSDPDLNNIRETEYFKNFVETKKGVTR